MTLDQRVFSVLDSIVKDPAMSSSHLEEKFNLSRKQLSYTLKKLNNFLESNHFKPIQRNKAGHFFVDNSIIDYFHRRDEFSFNRRYLFSEQERGQMIIFLLLTRSERLSLLHLSSFLNVSQNTIINDFKKIKPLVASSELAVDYNRKHGYHIFGEELAKRYLLLRVLRNILAIPIANNIVSKYNDVLSCYLEHVGSAFNKIEKKLMIKFTDKNLQELIYFICFVLHRITSGKILKELPKSYVNITHCVDFLLIKDIISSLGILHYQESVFITALIQSANIQQVIDKYSHMDTKLLDNVVKVVDNFEKISCVTFKNKDDLIEKIYQHWKPAYYRIRYHFNNNSSVCELVTEEFSYLHDIVRRSITPFEIHLHCELPDDEIAFLTIIFGGFLTQEGTINDIKVQKTAIVICENSATVSAYTYQMLRSLFPEIYFSEVMSKREFAKYDRHYDIIFSTTQIKTSKMLFVINPVSKNFHKKTFRYQVINALQGITSHAIQIEKLLFIFEKFGAIFDRKTLEKELISYIYNDQTSQLPAIYKEKKPSLRQLLPTEHIHFSSQLPVNWENAIQLSARTDHHCWLFTGRYYYCTGNPRSTTTSESTGTTQ